MRYLFLEGLRQGSKRIRGSYASVRNFGVGYLYRKRKILDPNEESREVRKFLIYPDSVTISKQKTPIKDYAPIKFDAYRVNVTGKLGSLSVDMVPGLDIRSTVCCDGFYNLEVIPLDLELRRHNTAWGSTARHLKNLVLGVSEAHYLYMELSGIGYRASLEGEKTLILKLGSPIPNIISIPDEVDVKIVEPTIVVMRSVDLNLMTEFAGKVRSLKRPEPYKLKGIFVNGETIKKKEPKKN